jgi:hypothetical protein
LIDDSQLERPDGLAANLIAELSSAHTLFNAGQTDLCQRAPDRSLTIERNLRDTVIPA